MQILQYIPLNKKNRVYGCRYRMIRLDRVSKTKNFKSIRCTSYSTSCKYRKSGHKVLTSALNTLGTVVNESAYGPRHPPPVESFNISPRRSLSANNLPILEYFNLYRFHSLSICIGAPFLRSETEFLLRFVLRGSAVPWNVTPYKV